jgi:hypothetical protein
MAVPLLPLADALALQGFQDSKQRSRASWRRITYISNSGLSACGLRPESGSSSPGAALRRIQIQTDCIRKFLQKPGIARISVCWIAQIFPTTHQYYI